MTKRILGAHGSRRRKRVLLLPVLVACAMASVFVTGAQAVHDSGAFQLDGNAFNTANSTPAMPTAADDADNICGVNPASTGDNTAGQGCHAATGVALPTTSGATKSGF